MSATATLMTAEQLLMMRGDARRELVNGEIRERAPAAFHHGAVANRIAVLVTRFVDDHALGKVFAAETGYILTRSPDTVRAPDVSFLAASRLAAGESPRSFWLGAPDLAVEVLSPGDTIEEVEDKVDEYLSAGTRLVWVVNPRRRTVAIYPPGKPVAYLTENQEINGGDVLPGFACKVAEFFV